MFNPKSQMSWGLYLNHPTSLNCVIFLLSGYNPIHYMNKSRKIPTLTQAQKATRRKKKKEKKRKEKNGVGGEGAGEGGGAQDKNTLPVWTTKQT